VDVFLGIDAGSVATKFALVSESGQFVHSIYLRVQGRPIATVQKGLREMATELPEGAVVRGVGTTGSARHLAAAVVGADVVKNEITSQVVAALQCVPEVQSIVEIGGQDSKIIIVRNGMVTDFGMNTVCAAGTGTFLEHQALRLNIDVEDLAQRAMQSESPVRIVGRCAVFAESDMVHRQQTGHPLEDILYGLCQALVRNYLGNVASGKEILPPVLFQGGVALNRGIVRALQEALAANVIVPPHCEAMGAIGVALLALEEAEEDSGTSFNGFGASEADYRTASFECKACPAQCEVAQLYLDNQIVACWGGRCDVWEGMLPGKADSTRTRPSVLLGG
jgi:predicted CoA-substrate-specific enzyme activase